MYSLCAFIYPKTFRSVHCQNVFPLHSRERPNVSPFMHSCKWPFMLHTYSILGPAKWTKFEWTKIKLIEIVRDIHIAGFSCNKKIHLKMIFCRLFIFILQLNLLSRSLFVLKLFKCQFSYFRCPLFFCQMFWNRLIFAALLSFSLRPLYVESPFWCDCDQDKPLLGHPCLWLCTLWPCICKMTNLG